MPLKLQLLSGSAVAQGRDRRIATVSERHLRGQASRRRPQSPVAVPHGPAPGEVVVEHQVAAPARRQGPLPARHGSTQHHRAPLQSTPSPRPHTLCATAGAALPSPLFFWRTGIVNFADCLCERRVAARPAIGGEGQIIRYSTTPGTLCLACAAQQKRPILCLWHMQYRGRPAYLQQELELGVRFQVRGSLEGAQLPLFLRRSFQVLQRQHCVGQIAHPHLRTTAAPRTARLH